MARWLVGKQLGKLKGRQDQGLGVRTGFDLVSRKGEHSAKKNVRTQMQWQESTQKQFSHFRYENHVGGTRVKNTKAHPYFNQPGPPCSYQFSR